MKYEAELIDDILEQRGHEKSSLHYQSECVETWIEEARGAYPKLCDYESEWLNYINENPIGDFPYETITDVTDATVNNVVPYGYKSAILSGNTLVNLSENLTTVTRSVNGWYIDEKLMNNIEKLKRNTYYTILYRLENLNGNHQHYNGISLGIGMNAFNKDILDNINSIVDKNGGWCKVRFQLTDDFIEQYPTYKQLHIRPIRRGIAPVEGESVDYTIRGFAILEGDYITNPIPFNKVFEGMQSVKLPVLTTSNEDGTKTNILTVNDPVELRGIGDVQDTLDLLTGEKISKLEQLTVTNNTNWLTQTSSHSDCYSFYYNPIIGKSDGLLICDNLPSIDRLNIGEGCRITSTGRININILKSKLNDYSLNSLNDYLAINPLTFIYELPNASIKTVDLTVTNQDGQTLSKIKPIEGTMHISTDGTPIKPTVTMEIPVEAITQNLASFIEE